MRLVFVTYHLFENKAEEFVKELLSSSAVQNVRKEEGCQMYEYFISPESKDKVVLHEVWVSEVCHMAHLAGPNMAPIGEIKAKYVASQDVEVVDKK